MAFSLPRFITSKICGVGETNVLLAQLVPAHCSVGRIGATVHVSSLPAVGSATAAATPFGVIEYNLFGLEIPFPVAATYTETVDSKPGVPDGTSDWDNLIERLVLNYGLIGSNEYYGANPDAAAAQLDLRKSPKLPPETTDSDDGTTEPIADTEVGYGPEGLRRLFNYERFVSSMTPLELTKTITIPSGFGGSLNDVVFTDSIDIDIPVNVTGPSFIVYAVQRFKTDATWGFAASYSAEPGVTPAISNADRRRAINTMMTGDMLRVKSMLADPSSDAGDYVRSVLFGGDTSIQPTTASSNSVAGQLWPNGEGFIRDNDINVAVKMATPMQTPYTIAPTLLG